MEIKENSVVFNNLVDISTHAGQVLGSDTVVEVAFESADKLKQSNASGDAKENSLQAIADNARNSGTRLRSLFIDK